MISEHAKEKIIDKLSQNRGGFVVHSSRNIHLDIVRAFAIILMVVGHSGCPATQFIYLFHIAVFFMVSGYFYHAPYTPKELVCYCIRKIKGLWLPFFIWNSIFILLNNSLIRINVYTDNPLFETVSKGASLHHRLSAGEILRGLFKSIFMAETTEFGGGFWFLRILFMISVLYALTDFLILRVRLLKNRRIAVQAVISVSLLLLGYGMYLADFRRLGLDRTFSCYMLFFLGNLFGAYADRIRITQTWKKAVCMAAAFLVLCFMLRFGSISLADNRYRDPLFLLINSLCGWVFLYEAAGFVSGFRPAARLLSIIGQNTLWILILHFSCFKLINFIGVQITGEPACCIADFPVRYTDGAWWYLYSLTGIILPAIIGWLVSKYKGASS